MRGMELLDLYERGSEWAGTKVQGAVGKLDAPTPCDKWKVRDVVNHVGDKARVAGMDSILLDVDVEYPGLSCTDEEPIRVVDIDLVCVGSAMKLKQQRQIRDVLLA